MELEFKKLRDDAVIPTYAHDGDAGLDLTAVDCVWDIENDCWMYSTGIAVSIPKGYFGDMRARSSNKKTECYLPNGSGVIDSTYRGDLTFAYKSRTSGVIIDTVNAISSYLSSIANRFGIKIHPIILKNEPPYKIGDRIGQLIIVPCPQIQLKEVTELSETTRGTSSYGSTDKTTENA